jgi:hypothetical protein
MAYDLDTATTLTCLQPFAWGITPRVRKRGDEAA